MTDSGNGHDPQAPTEEVTAPRYCLVLSVRGRPVRAWGPIDSYLDATLLGMFLERAQVPRRSRWTLLALEGPPRMTPTT